MKRYKFLGMMLLVLGMVSPEAQRAFAYEKIDIKNSGSIAGKVILKGSVPEPRVFPLVLYPFGPFCKKISNGKGHVLLKEFNVDPDGGLRDAVVAVQNVHSGKPFRHIRNEYVSVNCMFHPADVSEDEQFELHEGKFIHVHPLVRVMENHQPLYVTNLDPIFHNGQVYQKEKGNRILNFPLPISQKLFGGIIHLDQGKKIVQMICGMHEFMQAWVWVVDNPYYQKTGKGGEFFIDDLPPGKYQVTAWHPHIQPLVREVTVPPEGKVSVQFHLDADQVIRPHYETQEKFRIGPESHPYEDLEGCQDPFCVGE